MIAGGADERGSVTSITDATGTVTNINSYDEYGIPAVTNTGRFGYTGQTWLPEIGMNYYKARMYSPTLCRFMQPDPIGYGDGMNLYAYVGGDPVNFVDPSGLFGYSFNCPQADVPCDDDDGPPIVVVGARLSYCEKEANFTSFLCIARSLVQYRPCSKVPLNNFERLAAARGNRSGFWRSRAARGDRIGQTGLDIVKNKGLGRVANFRLFSRIADRGSAGGLSDVRPEMAAIGVELMRAHANAVARSPTGQPSSGAIAEYHARIFNNHNLASSTFGGAPITGSSSEAGITEMVWTSCSVN